MLPSDNDRMDQVGSEKAQGNMIIYTVTVFEEGEEFTDRLVKQIRAASDPAPATVSELQGVLDEALGSTSEIFVVREAAYRKYVPEVD